MRYRLVYLYFKEAPLALQKTDISKIKKKYGHLKKIKSEVIRKSVDKRNVNGVMLLHFVEKYRSMIGRDYAFRTKRFHTVYNSQNKAEPNRIDSDKKRLNDVFKEFLDTSENDISIAKEMIDIAMDIWSKWDKCSIFNLVGFLENAARKDIGLIYMKASKKADGGKEKKVLSNKNISDNKSKHRGYFE